jgi:hypothetical protein
MRCANRKKKNKEDIGKHLLKFGFMSNYTQWVFHGEAQHLREEVVRPPS